MPPSDADPETHETIKPVDPDGVTTDSLEALQSDEQRKILDIVDHLRRQGLQGIVELPQLVVCGDQSSGKSSVLEAVSVCEEVRGKHTDIVAQQITEIPFPRNENLCTRFATEVCSIPTSLIWPILTYLRSSYAAIRRPSSQLESHPTSLVPKPNSRNSMSLPERSPTSQSYRA